MSRNSSRFGAVVDALIDSFVISFALWTLLYCLGMWTQWSLWPSGWLWVGATVLIGGFTVRRELRRCALAVPDPAPVDQARERAEWGVRWLPKLLVLGVGVAIVVGVLGVLWSSWSFKPMWAGTLVALLVLGLWGIFAGRFAGHFTGQFAGQVSVDGEGGGVQRLRYGTLRETLLVLGIGAGLAVLTAFLHLPDTDDPYYLNRSVWVAEHGNAALRDTMFSPEVFNSPYGGGIPIASVESLFGVLAHMTGILAGTVTYLIAAPIASFLAAWALWRLARAWAPRRAIWVLVGAVAFLLLSGDSMLGNFWIPRMWQGKVIAIAVIMPLIWAYLTELTDDTRGRREQMWSLFLLLCAGIAFFGMTPTAVVWAPVMFGGVVLAALLRKSGLLALGGAAMLLGPLLSGLAVVFLSTSRVGGDAPIVLSAYFSYLRVLGGMTFMVALAALAMSLAPLLARRGTAAALALGSTLTSTLVFAPGILPLANAVTGSGPILWRMLFCTPVPILVGLLLAVHLPAHGDRSRGDASSTGEVSRGSLARALPWVAAAAVLVGFLGGGRPIWLYTGHGGPVEVRSSPQWKLDTAALADVSAAIEDGVSGVVVMPESRMKVLTMYSTQAFPIVPRHWFVRNISEPGPEKSARRTLYKLAAPRGKIPSIRKTRHALERLGVDYVCAGNGDVAPKLISIYERAGFTNAHQVGQMTCLTPGPGFPAADK